MKQKAVVRLEIIYIKTLKWFWEKHWFEKHKSGKIKGPNLKNVPVKRVSYTPLP